LIDPPFRNGTTEQKQQTPTPAQIPFTDPPAWVRFVTDTGKILPRKYTGLCAKHQRAVTRTIKHSRNMLLRSERRLGEPMIAGARKLRPFFARIARPFP